MSEAEALPTTHASVRYFPSLTRYPEPNQVVNPTGSVKQRAREYWREVAPRGDRAALSTRKQGTLTTLAVVLSCCSTCGKRETPRAEPLGVVR